MKSQFSEKQTQSSQCWGQSASLPRPSKQRLRAQLKKASSGIRNFLHKKIISVWEKASLCLNWQNRCHPLNILLSQISCSFSATQIPSFLLTDILVSSLTHIHTHAVTHTGELHLNMPALSPSLMHTHKDSTSLKHTVTLTVCRFFWFHNSNSSSLSTAGSRPVGITHTHRWVGVSLWPLTSINLSRNHTYWPF